MKRTYRWMISLAALGFVAGCGESSIEGVLECTTNEECNDPNKICQDNRCVYPEGDASKKCGNAYCLDTEVCVVDHCEPNNVDGVDCDAEGKCPSGYECNKFRNKCVVYVDVDGDCSQADHLCMIGSCKAGKCTVSEEQRAQLVDTDGDTISDYYDKCDVDTDNDTIMDCKDLDSDGDTIPDSVEARNGGNLRKPPAYSGDEGYDFLMFDSDGNGIPDMVEACPQGKQSECGLESMPVGKDKNQTFMAITAPYDSDDNGEPDYIDYDNDGDRVTDADEIYGLTVNGHRGRLCDEHCVCGMDGFCEAGTAGRPWDSDGDTIPDYMDLDSDGDTIPDVIEGTKISGLVDVFDRYSVDSDGDTILDKDELDANGNPLEINGVVCYRSRDCDQDGLNDGEEIKMGTDWHNPDSDGDGALDGVEVMAGTSPKNSADNPLANGDFVFLTPWDNTSTPDSQTLSFGTAVQTVDIYFSIDQSGSMNGEINTLKAKLPELVQTLQCADLGRDCTDNKDCEGLNNGKVICSEKKRCIVDPAVGSDGNGCLADMWTGVGGWGDVGRYINITSLGPDPTSTSAAISRKDRGSNENMIQAAVCVAVGEDPTLCPSTGHDINCYSGNDGRIGSPGFRPNAIKILIQAGDEANANSGDFTVQNVPKYIKYLLDNKIRFIGLWGDGVHKRNGAQQIACVAESCVNPPCARDCMGMKDDEVNNLFLAQINDNTMNTQSLAMIRQLTKYKKLDISADATDVDQDASKLVQALRVNTSGQTIFNRICTDVSTQVDTTPEFQTISKLDPGTTVCYDIIPVQNQKVIRPDPIDTKIYKAKINVRGDGSILNSGTAYFVVPAGVVDDGAN